MNVFEFHKSDFVCYYKIEIRLFYAHSAIFLDGDGHTVLYVFQELIAQGIHNGHLYIRAPYGGQDGSGCSQGVDGFGEEHTCGLTAHGACTVENQSACGGTDGLGQAQCFAGQFLAVKIRVVLVTAGGFFITELKRALQGCQCVEAIVGNNSFCGHGSGSNDTSFKFSHFSCLPS